MNKPLEGEFIEANDNAVEQPENLGSETLFKFTQSIRKELITDITKGGMPTEKAERSLLLQSLHDMDQTSVNRLRLDVDQESNSNNRAAQEIVSRLLDANPYGLRARPGEEDTNHNPVPDLTDLPIIDVNDGETSIGVVTESAKDFLARIEK